MDLTSLKDLSEQMGLNFNYLQSLIYSCDKNYYSYYLRKQSGKQRNIDAPNYQIKAVQSWILRNILDNIEISDRATGFVKGKGIKTNARFHINKTFILCMDLKDFFPSIKIDQVNKVFLNYYGAHNYYICGKLSQICTFRGYLPQGAVTSPALSNLIFKPVDHVIEIRCNKLNINYSRYADDLTFSSNDLQLLKDNEHVIDDIINQNGFELNKNKTRYSSGKRKKMVTGLILNSGRLTIGRDRKRLIRSILHRYIVKRDENINKNELFGYISFLRDIEPSYFKDKIIPYKNRLIDIHGKPN